MSKGPLLIRWVLGVLFTVSNLLGSRLSLLSLGGVRPVGNIQIQEDGSFGGSDTRPQFSLDAWGKAPVVEGDGSEAHLAAYL